jgi:hypothetical protein
VFKNFFYFQPTQRKIYSSFIRAAPRDNNDDEMIAENLRSNMAKGEKLRSTSVKARDLKFKLNKFKMLNHYHRDICKVGMDGKNTQICLNKKNNTRCLSCKQGRKLFSSHSTSKESKNIRKKENTSLTFDKSPQ